MNSIQQEAERRYPSSYRRTFVKDAFIAGATYAEERARGLVSAMEEMIRCTAVFKENMLSADVTLEEHVNALENAKQALNNYKTTVNG